MDKTLTDYSTRNALAHTATHTTTTTTTTTTTRHNNNTTQYNTNRTVNNASHAQAQDDLLHPGHRGGELCGSSTGAVLTPCRPSFWDCHRFLPLFLFGGSNFALLVLLTLTHSAGVLLGAVQLWFVFNALTIRSFFLFRVCIHRRFWGWRQTGAFVGSFLCLFTKKKPTKTHHSEAGLIALYCISAIGEFLLRRMTNVLVCEKILVCFSNNNETNKREHENMRSRFSPVMLIIMIIG
jgi:hypothetical protein